MASSRRSGLLLAAAALASFACAGGARADVIYASPSAALVNLGTASAAGAQSAPASPVGIDGETIAWSGSGAGVYAGGVSGVAASPYAGGSLQDYLAAEPGGSITINFASAQTAFSLLWGSVDPYNTVTFGSGATVTGADVISALGLGGDANVMVTIADLAPFTTATLSSSSPAFEFDPGTPVPEPASLALLAAGLLGLASVRLRAALSPFRRRSARRS